MANKCYICGDEATSKEHAPARSFFPEENKYRKNLITVRSCSKHNEDTSVDDEYVRNIITMSIGNNALAFKHFMKKTVSSFKNSKGLFIVTTKVSEQVYTINNDEFKPSLAFKIDRDRFENVIKKISYALFFNDYSHTWKRELIIMTEYLRTPDMKADEFGLLIQQMKLLLNEPVFDGNNPKVFKYKFMQTESDDINEQILWMKFYEGFEVFATPIKGSFGPII